MAKSVGAEHVTLSAGSIEGQVNAPSAVERRPAVPYLTSADSVTDPCYVGWRCGVFCTRVFGYASGSHGRLLPPETPRLRSDQNHRGCPQDLLRHRPTPTTTRSNHCR